MPLGQKGPYRSLGRKGPYSAIGLEGSLQHYWVGRVLTVPLGWKGPYCSIGLEGSLQITGSEGSLQLHWVGRVLTAPLGRKGPYRSQHAGLEGPPLAQPHPMPWAGCPPAAQGPLPTRGRGQRRGRGSAALRPPATPPPPSAVRITAEPSPEVPEGATVTMNCSGGAWRGAEANFSWYKDQRWLRDAPHGSIVLSPVSSADSGFYECRVSGTWGTESSAPLSLSVLRECPPPRGAANPTAPRPLQPPPPPPLPL